MKKRRFSFLLCLLCIVLAVCLHIATKPESTSVPILMFHDVTASKGGTWSITEENFQSRMEFLLANGYTPISFDTLIAYADGEGELPDKPVCVTFDDGYYSNYKFVLPIITELNIPITVFAIGSAVRPEGTEPSPVGMTLDSMSICELREMQSSPLVQIRSHTYALHIAESAYGTQRADVLPLKGEDKETYQNMFKDDCAKAESLLQTVGVETHTVFSYPGGKHHRWSEEVLRERGYRVTLTTDYYTRNRIVRGDPESLFLLGRMNVNDDTTDAELLKYLNRK